VEILDNQINNLNQTVLNLRRNIVKMIKIEEGGHLGGSFSCIEIITALYFSVLQCNPQNPQ